MNNKAQKPVILAGIEIQRFRLQNNLLKLIQKTKIPVAVTILGKSVVGEGHPLYLGAYEGAMGCNEDRGWWIQIQLAR